MSNKVHLIMPMGGAGIRFSQSVGFNVPKPLIPIREKPFLYWATKALTDTIPVSRISFIVLKEHVEKFHINNVIRSYFPDANIAVLDEQLNGPVLTCYEGIKQIKIEPNEMLLFNDCDHVFRSADLAEYIKTGCPTNGLVTFQSSEPQFSYIKYDESGRVAGTVEKCVVSDSAICGAYLFKDKRTFLDAAEAYISNGTGAYKEFFMSGLYNILAPIDDIKIFHTDFHISFGTPDEYREAQLPRNNFAFLG